MIYIVSLVVDAAIWIWLFRRGFKKFVESDVSEDGDFVPSHESDSGVVSRRVVWPDDDEKKSGTEG